MSDSCFDLDTYSYSEVTTSGHNKNIIHIKQNIKRFRSLYLNEQFSDLTLVVKDEEIPAHRLVLALNSEYFRALLYGGLKESTSNKIELKCERLDIFKKLLKYLYTGEIDEISSLSEMIALFQMSHEYNIEMLVEEFSKILLGWVNANDVFMLYDLSTFYELDKLRKECTDFLDYNAATLIQGTAFLKQPKRVLKDILTRDSFCVDELDILIALNKWIQENSDEENKELYQHIRMNLIDLEKLLELIKPSKLSSDEIIDFIHSSLKRKDDHRCFTYPENNVVTNFTQKIRCGLGEALYSIERDFHLPDLEEIRIFEEKDYSFVKDAIRPNEETFFIVRFKYRYKINLIKIELEDRDENSYSYYIETSLDMKNWKRVIDYSGYVCRSHQFLYFEPEVVKYVKIVAVSCYNCDQLEINDLQCIYTKQTFDLMENLIKPKSNVATLAKSAQVIEGVSRVKNILLQEEFHPDISFTSHQINNGSITIQLAQPYMISTIKFLLYNNDDRKYEYDLFVSANNKKWSEVARVKRKCKAWRIHTFSPCPVVFIKIVGTYCSVNQTFNLLRFECF